MISKIMPDWCILYNCLGSRSVQIIFFLRFFFYHCSLCFANINSFNSPNSLTHADEKPEAQRTELVAQLGFEPRQ